VETKLSGKTLIIPLFELSTDSAAGATLAFGSSLKKKNQINNKKSNIMQTF
jgi:hypothetical protein